MTTPTQFDPSRFLTLVSGKEYLEVKWRLVWLRSEHPDAVISTQLIDQRPDWAMFKATVSLPDGGTATGHGSEDARGFGDFIEKAETKAIGRALAALGYGTQFCGDFEFGANAGRVVNAPVAARSGAPQRVPDQFPHDGGPPDFDRPGPSSDLAATDRQRNLIQALAREQKISGKALDELSLERTGTPYGQITRQNASTLIEYLREAQPKAMA